MHSGSVDSGCHKLLENIRFVWSKTSYCGDKVEMSPMQDRRTDEQQVKIRYSASDLGNAESRNFG